MCLESEGTWPREAQPHDRQELGLKTHGRVEDCSSSPMDGVRTAAE